MKGRQERRHPGGQWVSCNRSYELSALKGFESGEQHDQCRTVTSSCWLEGRRWIRGGKIRVREPESRLCLQARPAMMMARQGSGRGEAGFQIFVREALQGLVRGWG